MTFHQFMALDEIQQALTVLEGTLIGQREDSHFKILLYQLDSFYVEVFYHPTDHFIRIESFSGTEKLDPYLNQISIEKLV